MVFVKASKISTKKDQSGTIKNISQKQWANLLIELNLVKQAWRRFGPIIDIKAKNFDSIIKWGRRKNDAVDD